MINISIPKRSTQLRPRADNRVLTRSIRTCSFFNRVYPDAKMNTVENRYHCNSRNAFEAMLRAYRDVAFAALTKIASSMSHFTCRPTKSFSRSICRENASRFVITG